ncbi:hypothetical protein HDU97_001991 [Phlyctochytrium planicorne]|nr:hypothetical protein HDU97_001991 [Phlyctochytrium planicorne]
MLRVPHDATSHLKLIQDAIDVIADRESDPNYGNIAWDTCRHPLALYFLARVGARKTVVLWALGQVKTDHPAYQAVVADLIDTVCASRQPGVLEALLEDPEASKLVPSKREELLVAFLLCGNFGHRASKIWAKDGVPNLVKAAEGFKYLTSLSGSQREVYLDWKYAVLSDELTDAVISRGKMSNWTNLIEYATPFAIRRIYESESACREFEIHLESSSHVNEMKWILHRKAMKCLDLACHHGHLELVKLLVEKFKLVPDNDTLIPLWRGSRVSHGTAYYAQTSSRASSNVGLKKCSEWSPKMLKMLLSDKRLKLTKSGHEELIDLSKLENFEICQAEVRLNFGKLHPFENFKEQITNGIRCKSRAPVEAIMQGPDVSPNEWNMLQFQLAFRHGELKMVKHLIKTDGVHAIGYEHVEVVKHLLSDRKVIQRGFPDLFSQVLTYIEVDDEDEENNDEGQDSKAGKKQEKKRLPIQPPEKKLQHALSRVVNILHMFLAHPNFKLHYHFDPDSAAKFFGVTENWAGMAILHARTRKDELIKLYAREVMERGCIYLETVWSLLENIQSAEGNYEKLEKIWKKFPNFLPEYRRLRGDPMIEMLRLWQRRQELSFVDEEEVYDRTGDSSYLSKRIPAQRDVAQMAAFLMKEPACDPVHPTCLSLASQLGLADVGAILSKRKAFRDDTYDLDLYLKVGIRGGHSSEHEVLSLVLKDPYCYPNNPRNNQSPNSNPADFQEFEDDDEEMMKMNLVLTQMRWKGDDGSMPGLEETADEYEYGYHTGLPVEIQGNILKELPPSSGRILASKLGIEFVTTSLQFAASSLAALGWQGDKLRALDWLKLGKHYVAALLSSVPVCLGLLTIICPHIPIPDTRSRNIPSLRLSQPCPAHKKLILDAIEILTGLGKNAENKIWPTCQHPLAMPFFAVLGLKGLLLDLLSVMEAEHPAVKSMLKELFDHAVHGRQFSTFEALREHSLTKGIFFGIQKSKKAAAMAICGNVEELRELAESSESFNYPFFLEDLEEALQTINPCEGDPMEDTVRGITFANHSHDHFSLNFSVELLLHLPHSEGIIDAAMETGALFTMCPGNFIRIAPSTVIRRMEKLDNFRAAFSLWLGNESFKSAKMMKDAICDDAANGIRADVVVAWLSNSVVKSQPWFSKVEKKALYKACLHKHLDLATRLVEELGVVPDNGCFCGLVSDVPFDSIYFERNSPRDFLDDPRLFSLFQRFLSHKVSPSTKKNLALRQVTKWGNAEFLKILLENKRLRLPKYQREHLINLSSPEIYRICSADKRFNFWQISGPCDWILDCHRKVIEELRDKLDLTPELRFLLDCKLGLVESVENGLKNLSAKSKESCLVDGLFLAARNAQEEVVEYLLDCSLEEFCFSPIYASKVFSFIEESSSISQWGYADSIRKFSSDEACERLIQHGVILAHFIMAKFPGVTFDLGSNDRAARLLGRAGMIQPFCTLPLTRSNIAAYMEEVIDGGMKYLDHVDAILDHPGRPDDAHRVIFEVATKKACIEVLEVLLARPEFASARLPWNTYRVLLVSYQRLSLSPEKKWTTRKRIPRRQDFVRYCSRLLELQLFRPADSRADMLAFAAELGFTEMVEVLVGHARIKGMRREEEIYLDAGKMNPYCQHEVLSVLLRKESLFYPALPKNNDAFPEGNEGTDDEDDGNSMISDVSFQPDYGLHYALLNMMAHPMFGLTMTYMGDYGMGSGDDDEDEYEY